MCVVYSGSLPAVSQLLKDSLHDGECFACSDGAADPHMLSEDTTAHTASLSPSGLKEQRTPEIKSSSHPFSLLFCCN